MSKYEAKIKTKFAELVIYFDNKEELKERLIGINDLIQILDSEAIKFSAKELPKIEQELRDIYSFIPDGLLKLLKFPKKKADIIRLALFLSPNPLNLKDITLITGVKNPLGYMESKHFMKLSDGMYSLESNGKNYVTSRIIPNLRSKAKK